MARLHRIPSLETSRDFESNLKRLWIKLVKLETLKHLQVSSDADSLATSLQLIIYILILNKARCTRHASIPSQRASASCNETKQNNIITQVTIDLTE